MLSYKVKSNAVCLAAYSSLLRGLISRSVRSRTLQVQTYIKHNHSNKKSDFLWVNMFQTQSYPLKTSVCWHRKCFISTLVTYPCVCVLVCVCWRLSFSSRSPLCVVRWYQRPSLHDSLSVEVFSHCAGPVAGRSAVIRPKIKQASSVAAVQFSTWACCKNSADVLRFYF